MFLRAVSGRDGFAGAGHEGEFFFKEKKKVTKHLGSQQIS